MIDTSEIAYLLRIPLTPLGWLYLWIRYRSKDQVKIHLNRDYDNSYGLAGSFVFWRILIISFLILLLAFIGVALYSMIFNRT